MSFLMESYVVVPHCVTHVKSNIFLLYVLTAYSHPLVQ